MMLNKVLLLLVLGISTCRAELTCGEDQTLIETDFLQTEDNSCDDLVAQVTDFYNPVFREECGRQLMLPSVPTEIVESYVSECYVFTNGTVKYRTQVCCQGKPQVPDGNDLVCFSCQDIRVQRDKEARFDHTMHCNYYGEVQSCPTGEVCSVVVKYAERPTLGAVTKGCMPKQQCETLAGQNEAKCDHVADAQCSYCCEDDYCNAEHPLEQLSVTGVCAYMWSNPCKNRGECIQEGDSFSCKCYPGRFGPLCLEDACDQKPCKNRAVCMVTESEPFYNCHCRNAWMGVDCTEPTPLCDVNNCQNGGTCYNAGEERCYCPEGFVGKLCEYSMPPACGEEKNTLMWNPNAWGNGRDCTNLRDVVAPEDWVKKFQKQCFNYMRDQYNPGDDVYKIGVNGEFDRQHSVDVTKCEQNYGWTWVSVQVCCASCGSNPCLNGGWCMQDSGSDGFVCRCRLNYGGFRCQNKLTTCFAAGDPHYYTFDGTRYHFQGLCKYTMAENQCPDKLPPFKVLSKNEVRGSNTDVSYPKYVEVEVYGSVIRLDKDNILRVDGKDVTDQIPFSDPKGENRFVVRRKAMELQLDTDFGLVVSFDGNWLIKVQVPPEANSCVDGLCRTYDGNSANDYILPDGTNVEDDPNGQSLLGNFFQVSDPEDASCPAVIRPNPPECDAATKADIDSNTYCGQIQNADGPFAACIGSLKQTAQMYMENCQYDVCAVSPDGKDAMKNAACESLKAFQAVCAVGGFSPSEDWRATTGCEPSCPGDLVFKASATACVPTCRHPTYPEECPFEKNGNCVCPDDSDVVTKDNKCVPAQTCGCFKEDLAIGDSGLNADCTERYECAECTDCARPYGKLVKSSVTCPDGETCLGIKDGKTKCGVAEWQCRPEDENSACACIPVVEP